jgi:hypothetical protein
MASANGPRTKILPAVIVVLWMRCDLLLEKSGNYLSCQASLWFNSEEGGGVCITLFSPDSLGGVKIQCCDSIQHLVVHKRGVRVGGLRPSMDGFVPHTPRPFRTSSLHKPLQRVLQTC